MKIAITGKGGSGKTMVAGALARHLATRGHKVVAIDADPNPNLGISLGVPSNEVEAMESILTALQATGYTHDQPLPDPDDLIARYGVDAPAGVSLVATGKIERPSDACLCCGSHVTTRRFFGDLPATDRFVVADLEAGLNDLIWAQPGPGDVVLIVAEPSAKSVEIAAGAARLARDMGVQRLLGVANRCASEADIERLTTAVGTDSFAIPHDPAVADADRRGVAVFDVQPTSAAMVAVGEVADALLKASRSR